MDKRGNGNGTMREQCIDVSLKIIAEEGIKNLSIREVARRIGVSHGAPYKHFANRDALITEIAIEGIDVLREYLMRGVDYQNQEPRDNFLRMCQNYVGFAMEQHDYFQLILWSDLPRTNDEYPRLATAAQDLFASLHQMLNHVKTRYDLIHDSDQLAVLHMFSTVHGYASLMSSGKLAVLDFKLSELERLAKSIANTVFDGLFTN